MQTRILTKALALLLSLSSINAAEPTDGDWLSSKIGNLDIDSRKVEKLDVTKFSSPEDRSRLVNILNQSMSSKKPLDEQTKKAVVVALKILSEQGTESTQSIAPLLEASDKQIRSEAAQALAVLKGEHASAQLKQAALSKMPQLTSSDIASQQEAIDLIRCALLAAPESERDALMAQLIGAMQKLKNDAAQQRQIELTIQEIRDGVAQPE